MADRAARGWPTPPRASARILGAGRAEDGGTRAALVPPHETWTTLTTGGSGAPVVFFSARA